MADLKMLEAGSSLLGKKNNAMKSLKTVYDFCVVSLSSTSWEYPYWVSRQFLMYELSRFCPVLYANGRRDIRNVVSLKYWKSKKTTSPPPFKAPENLFVQPPLSALPKVYRYPQIDKMLSWHYGKFLRKKSRKLTRGKIVAYVWEPGHVDLLDGLAPDLIVYHPYDKFDMLALNKKDRKRVLCQERQLADLADIIIVPSKKIADSFKPKDARVVHNAVFLPEAGERQPGISSLFDHIPRPRVGYIGTISTKLNFKLLHQITSHNAFSMILMGPQRTGEWQNSEDLKKLQKLPNFHMLPPVRVDEVFDNMKQLDLGIMPYSITGHAGFCESPLKMYQYWLCGLPVISTELPNLEQIPGYVSVAVSHTDWVTLIEKELKNDSAALKEKRKKLAMENSWANRAREIFSLLSEHEKISGGQG